MRFLFTSILSILLVSVSHAQTNVIDGHEYVDMGLPSGTLWATCNIGAESSTDFGDYFAWGETEPKEEYTNENYKFFEGYKEIPGVPIICYARISEKTSAGRNTMQQG